MYCIWMQNLTEMLTKNRACLTTTFILKFLIQWMRMNKIVIDYTHYVPHVLTYITPKSQIHFLCKVHFCDCLTRGMNIYLSDCRRYLTQEIDMQKRPYSTFCLFHLFYLNIIHYINFVFAKTAPHLKFVIHLVWLNAHATDTFTNKKGTPKLSCVQAYCYSISCLFELECVTLCNHNQLAGCMESCWEVYNYTAHGNWKTDD